MGYNVTLTDSDVVLPRKNQQEILDRWHEMNDTKYDSIKSGGSYGGGKKTESWYSWMSKDYHLTTITPEEILEQLGFEFSKNEKGDILIEGYDSKTGQESLFFNKIGDLASPGSAMSWRGEDGARYAWYFDGICMQEVTVKKANALQGEFVKASFEVQKDIEENSQKSDPTKKDKYKRYNL